MVHEIDSEFSTRSGIFTAISEKIAMRLDEYGQFEYEVNGPLSREEVSVIDSLDSLKNADEDEVGYELFGNTTGIEHDDILGYYSALYCGYAAEGSYRTDGTSGGLTTWLLVELLEKGMIDGAIGVTRSEGDQVLYEYTVLRTADEIRQSAKSRYYPMELSKVLDYVAENDGRYAIVGIPSFISDIRRLQKIDPRFRDRIRYTISLLCGHQKTTTYGEAMAFEVGIPKKDIESLDFRFKVEDGRSCDYVSEIVGIQHGERVRIVRPAPEVFVDDWGVGMFKANFSDYIDDCFGETADISLGDAWLPQYVSDGRGTNVAIVRNQEIVELLVAAAQEGRVSLDAVDAATVKSSQKGLIRHYRTELPYRLAKVNRPDIVTRVKPSPELPFLRKLVQDTRHEAAVKSKLYYREATQRGDWSYFTKKMSPILLKYNLIYRVIQFQNLGAKNFFQKAGKKLTGKVKQKIGRN